MTALAARWNRLAALRLADIVLVACLALVAWLVLVPLAALLYVAFTEDTAYGPGALTWANFVEAYGDFDILRLFANSLLYAAGAGAGSFALGTAVAWVVERT